jgi:hypothetical protein
MQKRAFQNPKPSIQASIPKFSQLIEFLTCLTVAFPYFFTQVGSLTSNRFLSVGYKLEVFDAISTESTISLSVYDLLMIMCLSPDS